MNSKDKLLKVTFDEIYENGYHATSVDKILKKANMNKGSMYHFFKGKKELVLAMIDTLIYDFITKGYKDVVAAKTNQVDAIIFAFRNRDKDRILCGCRINNLVQELSFKDKDFKTSLEKVYDNFEYIIEQALIKAIKNKEISHNNAKSLALFVVASFEGAISTSKKAQDEKLFFTCIDELEKYLHSLKS